MANKIDRFLKLMNDRGASDFHLTVGRPPMLRASGLMEIDPLPHDLRDRFHRDDEAGHAAERSGTSSCRPATSTSRTRSRAWRATASTSSASSAAAARSSASSRRRS